MSTPGILVVTGASGSGKTATVRALEAGALPGIRCYYFDAVGVPPAEDRGSGGPEGWQAVTTREWLSRLAADPDGAEVYVLDGQTRPSFVRSAVAGIRTPLVRIVLLDCPPGVRHARLVGPRRQPELSNSRMACWAAYLRGQADVLNLPVIDTSDLGLTRRLMRWSSMCSRSGPSVPLPNNRLERTDSTAVAQPERHTPAASTGITRQVWGGRT